MEKNVAPYIVRVERHDKVPFQYYLWAATHHDAWIAADKAKETLNAEKVEVWGTNNLEYLFCITDK